MEVKALRPRPKKSKTGVYSPISLTVVKKLHKKKYGLSITCGILMPSFDTIWCQEGGFKFVGIPSIGLFIYCIFILVVK